MKYCGGEESSWLEIKESKKPIEVLVVKVLARTTEREKKKQEKSMSVFVKKKYKHPLDVKTMTELVDELVKMSCEFAEIKKDKEQEVKSASVLKKGKVQKELVEADYEKRMAQMFRDVSITACAAEEFNVEKKHSGGPAAVPTPPSCDDVDLPPPLPPPLGLQPLFRRGTLMTGRIVVTGGT